MAEFRKDQLVTRIDTPDLVVGRVRSKDYGVEVYEVDFGQNTVKMSGDDLVWVDKYDT